MNKWILMLGILFMLASCVQKESQDFSEELGKIVAKSDLEKYQFCIVIPNSGCPRCVGAATGFVAKNIERLGNTLVIFTDVNDDKLLKLQLEKKSIARKNLIIDSQNLLKGEIGDGDYPQLLSLKKGRVEKVELFDSDLFNIKQ